MDRTRKHTAPPPDEQLSPKRELAYDLAEQVRRLRSERDWSGAELARRAGGMKQPNIARLEGANTGLPALSTLLRIAEATGTRLVITFENKET